MDEKSELKYAIKHGNYEKLEELKDFILNDPDLIGDVLESVAFASFKHELLNGWFETATSAQYENLKNYAKDYDDSVALKRIEEDMALLALNESNDIFPMEGSPVVMNRAPSQVDQQALRPATLLAQHGSSALFAPVVHTTSRSVDQSDQVLPRNTHAST